jgi:hypothetical protein
MNKTMYDKVKALLVEDVRLQSSDRALMARIWKDEMKAANDMPMDLFFTMFTSGQLSSYESITRARRKVQEKEVTLRGVNYKQRKKKAKKIARTVHYMHL